MINILKARVQMFCENCNNEHTGIYGSGRFCGIRCARGFSTKSKREDINFRVSSKMSKRKLSIEHRNKIEKANNFNRKEKIRKFCLNCNEVMLCRPSDKRKYCSAMCWVEHIEKNKEPFLLYRQRCNFDFDFDINNYPDKFDLTLIKKYGWYSPKNKGNNLNGVSKDHMLSVSEGFKLGIDPDIVKHPANCRVMLHKENQSKREKSSITLDHLLERIKNW